MNLDELQIKISIELDDLNKQLKTLTKDIDKALGPKATKKLMADNNKIIKNGLTAINKTTLNLVKKSRKDTTKEIDAMSKDINKSLTKAFDINLTKFNSNITSAMNQARQTVRSACNDIRRELNAALNINGNIRVTSKTSISGSATGSSGSNAASSISSGQYIGAMIIKATNAMLKNNNSNTSKLESKIDNSTNKIVSAIKNIKSGSVGGSTTGISNGPVSGNRTSVDNGSVGGRAENTRGKTPSVIEVPYEIIIDEEPLEQVEDKIKLLGEGFRALAIETGKVNFILGKTGDLFEGTVQRMREAFNMVKSLGTSGINFELGDTKEQILSVVELMKQIHKLRKGLVSDTTSFTYGEVITPQIVDLPMEQFKKVKEVIEDATYRVLDFEKALMNTSNFDLVGLGKLDTSQVEAMKKAFKDMQNIRKQSRMPRLNEPTEDYDASESMAKELHRQVASLMDMAQELNEAFYKTPMGIDKAVQQANFLEGALDAVLDASKDLTSLSPQIAKGFEFARDILNQMAPGIRALANEIRSFTKPQAPAGIPDLEWQEISPSKRPQTPASIIGDIEWRGIDDIDSSKLNDIKAQLQEIGEEFEFDLAELFHDIDFKYLEESLTSIEDVIKKFMPRFKEVMETLDKLDAERIKLDIDTTDAQNQIEALKASYEMLIDALKTNNVGNALNGLIPREEQVNSTNKRKYPAKPNLKRGDSDKPSKSGKPPKPTIMGFGFGAYKNEIDTLVEYAKKAASTVKKVISDALNPEVGPKALDEALTSFEGKAVSVAKKVKNAIVGIAKAIKDGIVGAFNFAVSQIEKAINAIIDSLKKLGQAITNVAKTIGNFLVQHANVIKAVVLGALSAIATAFMSSVNMIAGVITGVVLGLTAIIIKNLDKVAEIIKKLGTAITNVAKKVKDTLVNAFTTATDFIVNKFNKLTETVKQVATKIKINLMITFAYIADVIEDKFNKCIQVIKKVASVVANVAKTIKDALVNAFTTAVDSIVDKFNKIANTVKQVATKIKINLMITFAYIADVIEDKFNKVFEIIKKVGSAISNVAKTVKNTLVNAFTTAIDFIVDKFNKVATVINNAFTKIKVNLMITFAYVADVIEDKFNKIKDSITKVFKHITILAKAYGEVIAKHLNKILSPIANIAKKIKNNLMITFAYIADIIEDKFNKILGVIKKVGTSIANVAKKIVQPFKNGVDKIKNSIVQGFNKAVDSVKSVIGKITSSVKDGFGKATNSVKSAMSKISSSVKSGFNKAASSVKSAMGRVSSAIRSGFGKTKTTVNKMASSIKNSFSNIKTSKLYTNISKNLNKAKNAVSKFSGKVRTTLNKAFTGIKTGKINTNVSKALNKAQGAVTRFSGKARPTLNKVFDGIKSSKLYTSVSKALNKARGAVSKFSNKVRPTLNKAFSNIKVGNIAGKISKGLSKAKGALSKFASGCKTIWGKIKQIFSKGANDASRATGKLTSGLKGLLAQAFGFFSIYSLINLGREAITQSQTLAQSEIKLTSLMKQRMGATNDTVTAIRQLVEEQSKLGVVSKTALTRGAEQLSMYVHSAKALKELMPAIANLTAKRGGFMATEDDAEEIATQLGEAIREGTTTPLEQSGIYLSEAEIEKFKHLTTEEARAKFLADEIAKSVGDINKALANTPIGAMTQLKNNFKELLSTLGIFLANVLKPIVQWLNTIVVACNNALKALGKLLGFDMTGGATSVGDIGTGGGSTEIDTGGVDSATDSYNDAADAADKATEANEKFKGSLMGFDEINVLSDNTNKNKDDFDPTDITPGEGGQLTPLPEVGELTEGEGPFDKFADKMKAFMDEVLEPFKNAWKLYGNDLKEEWKDLVESFKHFCDSLGKFLKSVWEHGGKEFVQHLAEIGLACGIAAMEIGGEILDSLARLWDHLDPAKNMNTQGFLDALNEVSVKLRDFILGLGDHFESFMANGGQDLLNAFGDLAMNIGEAIVRGFGVGIDALDGLIDHLDPANNPKTKKMLKTWEETFGSIGDMALDFVGLLESTLKNGGQEIINSLGDLGVGILDAAGIVIGEIAKTFSELFKHMDPEKNENSKNMLESFDKFVDSLNDFVDAIAKAFKKFMDSGGREFVKNLGDILAIVADLAFTLGGGIIDLITGFINSFVGQKLIEGVAKALEWFSDKLLGLKDAVQIIKDAFQDVIDIIVGIFEGDGEKVGRAFASLIKNALKLTGELVEWLVQLGMDLVAGLVKGICSLPKLLWEAVKFLFDTLVGFFKELFGIHSPSTVFADLGVNLIEGLIEGIKGMLGAVGDVLSEIGEAIFGWFEDILSSASENWKKLCDETSKKWGELKENVSDKCKDIYEDTKEKWTDIKDKTIEIASDLKDKAVEKYTQLKDKLTDTTDKWRQNSEDKWSKVKSKTEELTTNLKNTVEDKYGKFRDKLTDTMESWRSNSEDKWTKVKNKTSDLVSNLKQDIEDRYTKFKDKLTDTMETWRSNNEDRWSKIKNKTSELVSNLKSDTESKYNTMKENLTSKLETFRQTSVDKWEDIKVKAGESINNLKKDVESKYETLKNNLTNKLETWRSTSESKWNNIKEKGVSAIENIRKNGEEKFESLKTSVISKMESIRSNLETKWNDVKNKAASAISTMKSDVENKYNELKTNICAKLEEVKSEANSKWESIKTTAGTKAREVVTEATNKFGEIKSSFTSKMDEAKKALEPKWTELKNSVKTNASGIASKVSEGLSNVKQKFTKPFEDAQRAVGDVINSIGRTFRNANWSFPRIKLPHIKVTGEWSFNPPRVPSFGIEWRKRGGIIDGITPIGFANGALQMGGEAGKEMVVPLENTSFTSKIAQAMGQAVDNAMARNMNSMYGSSANNSNDSKDIVLKVNERELARASINSINKLQRESGRTLLDI